MGPAWRKRGDEILIRQKAAAERGGVGRDVGKSEVSGARGSLLEGNNKASH